MTAAPSEPSVKSAAAEVAEGKRFAFGKNWTAFLANLDDDRIAIATQSLRDLLQVKTLAGTTFLDVGSGSGLFSLCARKLGAEVLSFDFDTNSVACAEELKRRYFPNDRRWTIMHGSALDAAFVSSLGTFDTVYSWGVLHHTGDMWLGLRNVTDSVKPQGKLAIALYNDQGWQSRGWLWVKQMYCGSTFGRWLVLLLFVPYFFLRTVCVSLVRGQNEFQKYRRHRGMSIVHDWLDWLGGLPFEVASVEEIRNYYEARGFRLANLITTKRLGNNEFVFVREGTND